MIDESVEVSATRIKITLFICLCRRFSCGDGTVNDSRRMCEMLRYFFIGNRFRVFVFANIAIFRIYYCQKRRFVSIATTIPIEWMIPLGRPMSVDCVLPESFASMNFPFGMGLQELFPALRTFFGSRFFAAAEPFDPLVAQSGVQRTGCREVVA